MPGFLSSLFPPSRPAFSALCVAGRPVRVSLILARWYAIPCGLCVPRARSGCPPGIPRVSPRVGVRVDVARMQVDSAPQPPSPTSSATSAEVSSPSSQESPETVQQEGR